MGLARIESTSPLPLNRDKIFVFVELSLKLHPIKRVADYSRFMPDWLLPVRGLHGWRAIRKGDAHTELAGFDQTRFDSNSQQVQLRMNRCSDSYRRADEF